MSKILAGAISGGAATVVMSVAMVWARQTGRVDAIGPEHIVDSGFDAVGVEPSEWQHLAVTAAAHLGYGATMGGVFALAGGRRRSIRLGLVYGTAIGVAGYQVWVPAMGILSPLSRAPRGRRIEVISSHLVYGATLVAVWNRLSS